MEHKFNKISSLLKKYETKFPNIVSLWKNYINIKKKNYEKNLDKCIEVFCNIENNMCDDIDIQTILFLLLLHSPINENN